MSCCRAASCTGAALQVFSNTHHGHRWRLVAAFPAPAAQRYWSIFLLSSFLLSSHLFWLEQPLYGLSQAGGPGGRSVCWAGRSCWLIWLLSISDRGPRAWMSPTLGKCSPNETTWGIFTPETQFQMFFGCFVCVCVLLLFKKQDFCSLQDICCIFPKPPLLRIHPWLTFPHLSMAANPLPSTSAFTCQPLQQKLSSLLFK